MKKVLHVSSLWFPGSNGGGEKTILGGEEVLLHLDLLQYSLNKFNKMQILNEGKKCF